MPIADDGQVTDDYDGEPLPEDTPQTHLGLGTTTYHLYLSEKSQRKLLEVLEPFVGEALSEDYTGRMHNMR